MKQLDSVDVASRDQSLAELLWIPVMRISIKIRLPYRGKGLHASCKFVLSQLPDGRRRPASTQDSATNEEFPDCASDGRARAVWVFRCVSLYVILASYRRRWSVVPDYCLWRLQSAYHYVCFPTLRKREPFVLNAFDMTRATGTDGRASNSVSTI